MIRIKGLPKDEYMKHTKLIAVGTLLLLGVSAATAQSLGDYAREARKNKTEPSSASHHYDNDNLPTGQTLSVVGPPPASGDKAGQGAGTAGSEAKAPAAEERQKAADEMQKKIDQQKEKIDSLTQELDSDQRALRLRAAAAMLGDPNALTRNTVQGDKDAAQYKSDAEAKQKALDAARQELDEMREHAHKAGIDEQNEDKDKAKDNSTDKNDKDK
jgi:hypothetical protein